MAARADEGQLVGVFTQAKAEGIALPDRLARLASEGSSPIVAIKILVQSEGIKLRDAKELVSLHPSFAPYVIDWDSEFAAIENQSTKAESGPKPGADSSG